MRHDYHIDSQRFHFRGNKNDIALLRLEDPIQFTNVISPACLNLERIEERPEVKLVVAGWGTTENGKLCPIPKELHMNFNGFSFTIRIN